MVGEDVRVPLSVTRETGVMKGTYHFIRFEPIIPPQPYMGRI